MSESEETAFFTRADAHIHLSNEQLVDEPGRGKVSASMMFAVARFNAWVSANGFQSGEDIARGREQTIEYFVTQYRAMLENNLDDYIANFSKYMAIVGGSGLLRDPTEGP